MFTRRAAIEDPAEVHLDGEVIPARVGEPIAAALLAAAEIRLARSPKLHRPRGPSCLRGDCDGCLMRVDGVPNVTTCLRAVRGGEVLSTQNVLGTRRTDLLRVTDWFFPKGIDHHTLLAGVPGVSAVMTTFARKMAGLGRLPEEPQEARPARRLACDALVVGGGLAGLSVAAALAGRGLDVHLVDEGLTLGGSQLALGDLGALRLADVDRSRVQVLAPAAAIGIYEGEVVVVSAAETVVVSARAVVLATGAHDGVLAVPNNDLPGVFSARAIGRLAGLGISLAEPFALVGEGRFADHVADGSDGLIAARLPAEEVGEIEGGSAVRAVTTRDGRRFDVAAVVTDLPPAPSFELGEQAGAGTRLLPGGGYALIVDPEGRAAPGIWAVGSCTGTTFAPATARVVAAAVAGE